MRIGTNRFVRDLRRYRITAAIEEYLSRSNRRVKFAPGVQSPAISILAPKGGKRCSPGSPQALAASGSSKARRCSS